ncbi:MAG: hypothetical protein KGN84_13235, partial [Acidobacteriota bacterium]|nr:hypothetical protein [Acidobacteriota bacterium]
ERAACLAVLPLAAAATYATIRLAMADSDYRANTTESLASAVQIEPGNAEYHELLAEHLEGEDRNADADRQAAARLSPLDSRFWIDLGVRDEAQNDFAGAEKLYLHAAAIDRMFVPRWTLMNFYFRRQDEASFWKWTKEALAMGYDDLSAAYRLCWQMTDDPRKVENVLPANDEVRRNYLFFLAGSSRFQDVSPLDHEVASKATSADYHPLIEYCERVMAANSHSAADVWNTLCAKRLLPFAPVDPQKGNVVTNPEFKTIPMERGLDWRLPVVEGATLSVGNDAPGLNVQLSGDQPENCVLAWQYIPLEAGRNYKLSYRYYAPNPVDSSGLSWELLVPVTNAPIAHSEDLKLTGDAASGQLLLESGSNSSGVLVLRYRREPGTVRHEESALIQSVRIEAQP